MVGMQSQISWLTNVFEKSMSTPDDGIAAKCSLTISQIQEFEDGLTVQQNKVGIQNLIDYFVATHPSTYTVATYCCN